jgi:hypothetical protein
MHREKASGLLDAAGAGGLDVLCVAVDPICAT